MNKKSKRQKTNKKVDRVVSDTEGHYHIDEDGFLVRCYHGSKSILGNWRFWAGLTLGFPFEHLLWEKLWPFKILTVWLGL